jgi:hypothetical protein
MENALTLFDGTNNGQLKVRVFSFLNRLDVSRNAEQEQLQQCVSSVFKCSIASGMVTDWVEQRSCTGH